MLRIIMLSIIMLSISTLSAVMLRVVASSPTNFSPQLCDAGGCDLLLSKALASFGLKSIVNLDLHCKTFYGRNGRQTAALKNGKRYKKLPLLAI
jgi:hypothetical protein